MTKMHPPQKSGRIDAGLYCALALVIAVLGTHATTAETTLQFGGKITSSLADAGSLRVSVLPHEISADLLTAASPLLTPQATELDFTNSPEVTDTVESPRQFLAPTQNVQPVIRGNQGWVASQSVQPQATELHFTAEPAPVVASAPPVARAKSQVAAPKVILPPARDLYAALQKQEPTSTVPSPAPQVQISVAPPAAAVAIAQPAPAIHMPAPSYEPKPARQPQIVVTLPSQDLSRSLVAASQPRPTAPLSVTQVARNSPLAKAAVVVRPSIAPDTTLSDFGQELAVTQTPVARELVAQVPVASSTTAPQDNENLLVASTGQQSSTPTFHFTAVSEAKPVSDVGPEAVAPLMAEPMPIHGQVDPSMYDYGPTGCQSGECPYGSGQSGAHNVCGVDCGRNGAPCCSTWSDAHCIPWSLFGPGEYVGPARPAHVSTYYLRVNDLITLTFIESRKKSPEQYQIGVGDTLRLEWLQGTNKNDSDAQFNRDVVVQPDGTVVLPLVGEAVAAGKTVPAFQKEVTELFGKYQRDPQITVTPLTTNMGIQDILKAVIGRNINAGQVQDLRVTPEGTIQAAGIGSVYVQGLTLEELRSELEARYSQTYGPGLTITPALTERATNYVFLGGEVRSPGRYTLEGPTTIMQAIAMAGGWNNGGNTRQVVVFRRDENWCLTATKVNLRAALYGNDPCPVNDVWLRDNDFVLVPKQKILCATDVIELYFTRGIYAVFPISYVYDFTRNSTITPIP